MGLVIKAMPLGCVSDSGKGRQRFGGHDGICDKEPPDQRTDLQDGEKKHRAAKGLFLRFVAEEMGCGKAAKRAAERHQAQQAAFGYAALVLRRPMLVEPHGEKCGRAEGADPVENDVVGHGRGF